uniref:Uncharacterized protein n=1 Tax=Ailuropoda melanoleuca TaxID=9646 RepID=A0A7N5KPR0_AILME
MIEDTFQQFLSWDDSGIVSINPYVAEMVRRMPDTHQGSIHAVLESLSQEHPYDAARTPSCARRGNCLLFTASSLGCYTASLLILK